MKHLWLAALFPLTLHATVPTHFGDKVEAALLCRDEWSTAYWRSYFREHFKAPLRVWGDAEWFAVEGAELAGAPVLEVFANTPEATALMVGAYLDAPLDKVRKTIEEKRGVSFYPIAQGRFITRAGSVLAPVPTGQDGKTKWYCARWNLGNRP